MERINALLEHWREEPPVSVLVRAFVGYKAPERKGVDGVDELKQMFPRGLISHG
jgi:hypothetical protein